VHQHRNRAKYDWRTRVLWVALVCFVAFHGAGLFHHHATQAERDACVACQVAQHQALDVPEVGFAPLFALFVLLFAVPARQPRAVPTVLVFDRPHSRAPPSSLAS